MFSNKKAWCWQDEWYGLTMDDIREIEKETQRQLALKMNQAKRGSKGSVFNEDQSIKRKSSNRRTSSIDSTGKILTNNLKWF